jgi:hypothetical protein
MLIACPIVLTTALVLAAYVDTSVDLEHARRALLVSIGAVAAVQLSLTVMLRSTARGAFVTIAVGLVIVYLWVIPLVMIVYAAWERRVSRRLSRPARLPSLLRAASGLTIFALAFMLLIVGTGISRGALGLPSAELPPARPNLLADHPDIYLILLDGHARADTLVDQFDVDPTVLVDGLTQRGFQVAQQSRSNYTQTAFTMVSMLYMRHIDEILAPGAVPASSREQFRVLSELLDAETPATQALSRAGYEIVVIPTEIGQLDLRAADRFLDSGHLNNLEVHLIRESLLYWPIQLLAPEFLGDQFRGRSLAAFEDLVAAGRAAGPQLVLAHVMLPHAPFVFDRDGEPLPLPKCLPRCGVYEVEDIDRAVSLYAGQWHHTTKQLLSAVDGIEPDGEHVVVVMSDHGSRLWPDDHAEKLRNFFAARTPGHPNLFPDTTSPVNVFPLLLAAYLDMEVPLQSATSYYSTGSAPWPIAPHVGDPSITSRPTR